LRPPLSHCTRAVPCKAYLRSCSWVRGYVPRSSCAANCAGFTKMLDTTTLHSLRACRARSCARPGCRPSDRGKKRCSARQRPGLRQNTHRVCAGGVVRPDARPGGPRAARPSSERSPRSRRAGAAGSCATRGTRRCCRPCASCPSSAFTFPGGRPLNQGVGWTGVGSEARRHRIVLISAFGIFRTSGSLQVRHKIRLF
jgi:hypothetical protein